jgi:hypothetical protein
VAWRDIPGVDNSEQILADIRDLLFIHVCTDNPREREGMVTRFIARRMKAEPETNEGGTT